MSDVANFKSSEGVRPTVTVMAPLPSFPPPILASTPFTSFVFFSRAAQGREGSLQEDRYRRGRNG